METTIGLFLIVALVLGNLLFTEVEQDPSTALAKQQLAIPQIDADFKLNINWWHSVDRLDMGLNQHRYLSNLQLAAAPRHVLVPFQSGKVKAFEQRQGDWEWTYDSPFALTAGVVVAAQYAYVAGEDGDIHQFDAFNGRFVAQYKADNAVISLAVSGKHLFAYSVDGQFIVFDINTGKTLWQSKQNEPNSSIYGATKPLVINDKVVMGSGSGQVYVYRLDNGDLLNVGNVGQPRGFSEIESLVDVDAKVLAHESLLIAAAYGGPIKAMQAASVQAQWQYDASVLNPMLKSDNALIAQTDQGSIVSLGIDSGVLSWRNDLLQFRQLTEPRLLHQQNKPLLVTTDAQANYFFIDAQTGKLSYHYAAEYPLALPLLVTDQAFFALNQQGELFSYRLHNKD